MCQDEEELVRARRSMDNQSNCTEPHSPSGKNKHRNTSSKLFSTRKCANAISEMVTPISTLEKTSLAIWAFRAMY